MKPLTPEQLKAILDWMEDRISRPFRESFAAAFPAVTEIPVKKGKKVTEEEIPVEASLTPVTE